MAKKKGQKKQSGTKLLVSAVVALVLLVVGIVGGSEAYRYSNSYILTVNGEKISTSEYMLNLYNIKYYLEYYSGSTDIWNEVDEEGNSYVDMAREYAVNEVLKLVATEQEAEARGIAITDEDDETVQSMIDEFTASYGESFMTEDNLRRYAEKSVLYDKVVEAVGAEYEMDEDAAEEAYATYLTESKQYYMTVNVDYIRVEDDDTAHTVLSKLKDGEDVVELAEEYSIDYMSPEDQKAEAIAAAEATEGDEETIAAAVAAAEEAEYVNYGNIKSGSFSDEIIAAAFDNMEVGDISKIYEDTDGTHVIFQIHSIDDVDYDQLKTDYMEYLLSSEQSTYATNLVQEWASALEYKLNQRVYDLIDITSM